MVKYNLAKIKRQLIGQDILLLSLGKKTLEERTKT
jgi:hypothetical protein